MSKSKSIAKMLADAINANASMLSVYRINELGGVSFEVHDANGDEYTVKITKSKSGS